MNSTTARETPNRRALIVGASRGLGEAVVEEYVSRGALVVGTARAAASTPLHRFAATRADAVDVEELDVTVPVGLEPLRERLQGRRFDLLFVVAGISLAAREAIGADIDDEDFQRMMLTNVLGVMRAVEALDELVEQDGTIAVMSSGQGSIAGNTGGGFEVYRATKAALNQMFRSYAARHGGERRSLLLLAPGWVRTELGGGGAPLRIEDSIPLLVDTIDAQHGTPGVQYLDRHGRTVAW